MGYFHQRPVTPHPTLPFEAAGRAMADHTVNWRKFAGDGHAIAVDPVAGLGFRREAAPMPPLILREQKD